MPYPFFSHNGEILPNEQAAVPLSRVEYSYGFGVYETIRVSHGLPLFADDHCERLINSAKIIGVEHNFSIADIKLFVADLIAKNQADACNLKLLLIGGAEATLDILCLNPLFPDRKFYRDGVKVITYKYEREFPQAKTLNMLSSYLAHREAGRQNAYDALLIDHGGNIREGTRTNLLALSGTTLISPPDDKILPGVIRAKVLEVAVQNGLKIEKRDISPDELSQFDALFLTSTSSKILPINQVNDAVLAPPDRVLLEFMKLFNKYLDEAD